GLISGIRSLNSPNDLGMRENQWQRDNSRNEFEISTPQSKEIYQGFKLTHTVRSNSNNYTMRAG
ncbi:MAG: hypothetical protein ACRD9Y_02125, partial [Blastocatellia bacterium]